MRNVGCGDNLYGICAQQTYYRLLDVEKAYLDSLVYESEYLTTINRLTSGATLRYQPTDVFSSRLTVGFDRAQNRGRVLFPFNFPVLRNGMYSLTDNLLEMWTVDFVSNYTLDFSNDLSSDLAVGVQRISNSNNIVEGSTENLPGPGDVTLSSGGLSFARESQERVITGGVFAQAVLKYLDRYFVTVGAGPTVTAPSGRTSAGSSTRRSGPPT